MSSMLSSVHQSNSQSVSHEPADQSVQQLEVPPAVDLHSIPEHAFLHQLIDQAISLSNPLYSSDVIQLIVEYIFELHQSNNQCLIDHTEVHWFAVTSESVSCVKKQCNGMIHKDTIDYSMVSQDLVGRLIRGWRVQSVVVWADQCIRGIKFEYGPPNQSNNQQNNQSIDRPINNFDSAYENLNPNLRQVFDLKDEEHISSMTGGFNQSDNQWINYLKLSTNQGRVFEAGSKQNVDCLIDFLPYESHARILALRVGLGNHLDPSTNQSVDHLDYLGCWFERMYPRTKAEMDDELARNTPSLIAASLPIRLRSDY